MNIRGIEIAPEGAKCTCYREPLSKEKGMGGISYATAVLYSTEMGESVSLTMHFCRKCARYAVECLRTSIGSVIMNDAIESGIRTLVRLRGKLSPQCTE